MESRGLFERAMTGEKTAYAEWCSLHHAPIARFGYQNGVPACHLQAFQLDVFRRFHSQLPASFSEEREAEKVLIKIACGCLPPRMENMAEAENEKILRFEEDEELHQSLQRLDKALSIPFTLFYFHRATVEELAFLLEQPGESAGASVQEAFGALQEILAVPSRDLMEKRLEFLAASYNRFAPRFQEEELFAAPRPEEKSVMPAEEKSKTPVKKGAVATIGIAAVFLVGVIGTSFTMNSDATETTAAVSENQVDKQTVKAWKTAYEEIRESSPKRLGVDPAVYEKLEYVQRADAKIEQILRKSNIEKFEKDPKALQKQVDEAMRAIETPKGMYESLNADGLAPNETAAFLQSFALKTKELMDIADSILLKHKEVLSGAFLHSELSVESIKMHKELYPEEVGKLVDALDESMLMLSPHPKEARFLARRNLELLYGNDLILQDMYGYQYLALLENEPYFDNNGLLLPVDIMAFHLPQIERFLMDSAQFSTEAYSEFEFIFQHAFWLLLKGTERNPVFDANGIVNEDYRRAWGNLVTDTANPLIYMMLPIIEEMEASGWKESKHYNRLAYPDILEALEMEKKGELAAKLPNGEVSIEAAFMDMKDFSYDQAEELYSRFAENYDASVLKGAEPLDVLFVYHYANKRKDPETMWHLLAEDKLKPTLAEYTAGWKQQPDIAEEALWVEIYEESMYRIKEALYVEPGINYRTENALVPPAPVLVTEEDHIWLVKNQMYEGYSLGGNKEGYEKKIESLYKSFSENQEEASIALATPGEIAGVFLKASDQGDYESMYALIEESAKTISLEAFRHQIASRDVPEFSSLKQLAFALDPYDYEENQRRGWVRLNTGQGSGDSYEFYELAMVETEKGWRMGDMNTY